MDRDTVLALQNRSRATLMWLNTVKTIVAVALVAYTVVMVYLYRRGAIKHKEQQRVDTTTDGDDASGGGGTTVNIATPYSDATLEFAHLVLFGRHSKGVIVIIQQIWYMTIVMLVLSPLIQFTTLYIKQRIYPTSV